MGHHHHGHVRLPMWASPWWMLVGMVAAGFVGAPFYLLWHPLGWAVGVVAYLWFAVALLYVERARRDARRVAAAAVARVTVRSPRG